MKNTKVKDRSQNAIILKKWRKIETYGFDGSREGGWVMVAAKVKLLMTPRRSPPWVDMVKHKKMSVSSLFFLLQCFQQNPNHFSLTLSSVWPSLSSVSLSPQPDHVLSLLTLSLLTSWVSSSSRYVLVTCLSSPSSV